MTTGFSGQAPDLDTVRRLKDALSELPGYKFRYLDNHATLDRDLSELRTDLVFNLCDEGLNNDPFKELHVPAMLEALELPYTGAGPSALAAFFYPVWAAETIPYDDWKVRMWMPSWI